MLEIDQIVNTIRNGEWHKLDEIFRKCKLPEVNVRSILKFLVEYDFIEINDSVRKVKVSPSLQKFLEETQL